MKEMEEGDLTTETTIKPSFPNSRVKKIMKLDKDINKVNSEALFLVSSSAELFLQFLADKSARVSIEKKRKTVKLDDLRVAVKRHRPTSDFLLDCLPVQSQPSDRATEKSGTRKGSAKGTAPPPGSRKMEDFFNKSSVSVETES